MDPETIVALSTPPGVGAIAVVRISGPKAIERVQALCPELKDRLPDRRAMLLTLSDAEGTIDEAVVTAYHAPRSYTGEDVVEISVHGSTYIQQRTVDALCAAEVRPARPGEFTLRAFQNRKLDLSQAEAVADLIAVSSAAAHRLAMQQLRGGYSDRIEALRQQLIDMNALVELELDFSEEDVEFADRDRLKALLSELLTTCTGLIGSFRYGNAIRTGIPVAIIGAPNSGKSTLLNTLLDEDRALVSDVPGTTRDTVEEAITLDGILFRFIDTAGIRTTEDQVEQMGIERSYRKAGEARVVLLLADATAMNEQALITEAGLLQQSLGEGPQVVPVLTKLDLQDARPQRVLGISARTGEGMDGLREELIQLVAQDRSDQADIVVTNARHVDALQKAAAALEDAGRAIEERISGELLAIDLRRAQHHLGEITGRITTEDLLGSIFSRFCIGK